MNVIDLFWFTVSILVAIVSFSLVPSEWGSVAAIVVAAISVVAFNLVMAGLDKVFEALHRRKAKGCECGVCKPDEFTWVGEVDGYPVRQWKCGIRTIRKGGKSIRID